MVGQAFVCKRCHSVRRESRSFSTPISSRLGLSVESPLACHECSKVRCCEVRGLFALSFRLTESSTLVWAKSAFVGEGVTGNYQRGIILLVISTRHGISGCTHP